METQMNAMRVMREDIKLLEQIARSYDNNPNFRHEVGRVTAVREMARGGKYIRGSRHLWKQSKGRRIEKQSLILSGIRFRFDGGIA